MQLVMLPIWKLKNIRMAIRRWRQWLLPRERRWLKILLKIEKKNSSLEEFEYHDKGSMATVGRNLAVVDIPKPKLHFKGFFAWMIWMGLHLFLLLGVKNRVAVFFNWIYNYITYDQNLRLIFRAFKKPDVPQKPVDGAQLVASSADGNSSMSVVH